MSGRALLVLAVIAGVAQPAGAAARGSRAPASATATATTGTAAAAGTARSRGSRRAKAAKPGRAKAAKPGRAKTAKATKRKTRRDRLRRAEVSRTPSRKTLRNTSNMPRGFTWPPSAQMRAAEERCQRDLTAAGVAWSPAASEGRMVAALTIDDAPPAPAMGPDGQPLLAAPAPPARPGAFTLGGVTYRSAYRRGPHKLDCQLALALVEVGPALREAGVREITFGSIFRWTNVRVNGKTRPFLSRHALGLAMDIVSFTDEDGRVAVVEHAYPQGDPLLLAVEELVNASGRWRVVLTPRNDPASHADHFHIEVAVDYTTPVARL